VDQKDQEYLEQVNRDLQEQLKKLHRDHAELLMRNGDQSAKHSQELDTERAQRLKMANELIEAKRQFAEAIGRQYELEHELVKERSEKVRERLRNEQLEQIIASAPSCDQSSYPTPQGFPSETNIPSLSSGPEQRGTDGTPRTTSVLLTPPSYGGVQQMQRLMPLPSGSVQPMQPMQHNYARWPQGDSFAGLPGSTAPFAQFPAEDGDDERGYPLFKPQEIYGSQASAGPAPLKDTGPGFMITEGILP
jgi:hypothetical protein